MATKETPVRIIVTEGIIIIVKEIHSQSTMSVAFFEKGTFIP